MSWKGSGRRYAAPVGKDKALNPAATVILRVQGRKTERHFPPGGGRTGPDRDGPARCFREFHRRPLEDCLGHGLRRLPLPDVSFFNPVSQFSRNDQGRFPAT